MSEFKPRRVWVPSCACRERGLPSLWSLFTTDSRPTKKPEFRTCQSCGTVAYWAEFVEVEPPPEPCGGCRCCKALEART